MINQKAKALEGLRKVPASALIALKRPTKRDELIDKVNKGLDLWVLNEEQERKLFAMLYDKLMPLVEKAEDLLDDSVKETVVDWANSKLDAPVLNEKIEGWVIGLFYDLLVGAVIAALEPYLPAEA